VASHVPLGRLLVETGRLDEIQLMNAVAYQKQWGGRLGEAIVALRLLPESDVLAGVALQRGIPYVEIGRRMVSPKVLRLLPEKFIRKRKVFPLALDRERPLLARDRDIAAAIERHLDHRA
jgi:type IV pilus assembly protein PilB